MIGRSINRIDGPLKVTGRAAYSYERQDAGQALHGFIRGAEIGKGRISRIDTRAAQNAPGVVLVMTHLNAPAQGPIDRSLIQWEQPRPMLTSDRIGHFGQPVAFVVASSFEQARAAAALISIEYEREHGAFDLAARADQAYAPKTANVGLPTDSSLGNLEQAMAEAPVKVDEVYSTPYHFSQPMEPHACLATWSDARLDVYCATQIVATTRRAIALTLGIPAAQVHVDAAFVGGGFGSKLGPHAETMLAALAARELGRPVKVALTRRQVFTLTGHRPAMIHRVRLAAKRDGQLTGIGHDANMQNSPSEEFIEQAATITRSLYAAPNRLSRHRATNLDLAPGEPVRGPGELPGLLAVETAMDELAHKLDIDPVKLRLINDTQIDPELKVPLSGRRLADCLRTGAERFGWSKRPLKPASRREGRWLIGYGVASAIRMHFQGATKASVRMEPDGRVIVKCDMTDIGTGTYTIAAQVAAEALKVPIERVNVQLARSEFPETAGSGGSWGAPNTAVAIHRACEALMQKLKEGKPEAAIEATGETLFMGNDPNYKNYSQNTYGACFAEVAVDSVTGEVRVRRMLGVFAAGRIINPKTARSQLIGGMIWGVSAALHEAAHVDARYGNYVNGDLAEYLVPVHADIPAIDAVMLDDFDDKANHLGIKGVGELGVCGTGNAVANAVFNATGVRVRDFPITLDKLLPGLP
jgi:xanthine dehydrogenase YagR molybdenum-binding subunit